MSSLPNNYTHAAPNQCNQPNKETDKPCSKNKIRLTTTGRRCIWNTSEVVVLSAQIWARILVKIHTVSISRQSLITTVIRGHHKFLSIQEVIFVLCCLKGELYFFARECLWSNNRLFPRRALCCMFPHWNWDGYWSWVLSFYVCLQRLQRLQRLQTSNLKVWTEKNNTDKNFRESNTSFSPLWTTATTDKTIEFREQHEVPVEWIAAFRSYLVDNKNFDSVV